jgi:hypothetical protein
MNDAVLQNDDNVWNDRQTDDFLRYIKFDYYVLTLYISCFLMDLFAWYNHGKLISVLGVNSFNPSGIIMITLLT